MSAWAVVLLLLLGAGCTAAVWWIRRRRKAEGLPYARRSNLLSPAGREFLQVLDAAAGPDYRVFAKVPAAQILRVTRPENTSAYERARQRLAFSHFDFVVCKRAGMRIACVVQLDERSRHQRQLGEADPFLADACRIAGLPLLRVVARRQYVVADIRARVRSLIASGRPHLAIQPVPAPAVPATSAQQRVDEAIKAAKAMPTHPSALAPTLMASIIRSGADKNGNVPSCPRCGGAMVRRHIHIGNHPGGDFWSCIRFPRCRGIMPIVEQVASSGT